MESERTVRAGRAGRAGTAVQRGIRAWCDKVSKSCSCFTPQSPPRAGEVSKRQEYASSPDDAGADAEKTTPRARPQPFVVQCRLQFNVGPQESKEGMPRGRANEGRLWGADSGPRGWMGAHLLTRRELRYHRRHPGRTHARTVNSRMENSNLPSNDLGLIFDF